MKFWVLDLGVFSPSDWHSEAIEWEGDSASRVAEECAETWDEDYSDGQTCEVLVAEDREGRNAYRYKVCTTIEVSYDIRSEKPYEIPPPEAD